VTHHTLMRRRMKRLPLLIFPVVAILLLTATPAIAHNSTITAPNGRSPFYSGYKFRLSGNHYGQGTHTEANGHDANDYYALDLNPIIPDGGSPCNRKVLPLWDNLKVTYVHTDSGFLRMEGRVNGGRSHQLEYRHLNRIYVKTNDVVGKSTVVGLVGDKGRSSSCHLHLSIRARFSSSESEHARHGHPLWSRRPFICGSEVPNDKSLQLPGCY